MLEEFVKPVLSIDFSPILREFERIADSFSSLTENFKLLEDEAVEVLRKYKWFIIPSMPITILRDVVEADENLGRQDKQINQLFINYFRAHDWYELERLVMSWKDIPLFSSRYKILADCMYTIKQSGNQKINIANVVLPTLIIQIDAIMSDYLSGKGIIWDVDYIETKYKRSGDVNKVGRITEFEDNRSELLSESMDELFKSILLDILFQRYKRDSPLAIPFGFNRHKIIHGSTIRYGRMDYLIRAFMILDILANLE